MDATRLGVLMNVRGLMELVVLNVGLDLGLVSPPLYTMMVLMALATTVMAVPADSSAGRKDGSCMRTRRALAAVRWRASSAAWAP